MDRYLITGVAGFVGRHFLELLEGRGEACLVRGLDMAPPAFADGPWRAVRFDFEQADLLENGRIEAVVRDFRPDYVLHLASFSSVAFSWQEPVLSFRNNTNIFLNLMEALRRAGWQGRLLSVGSSEEYGSVGEADLPLAEDRRLAPVSPYAAARVAQEYLSRIYAAGYGMDIVLTRSFNHIGPGQREVFFVSAVARQLVGLRRAGRRQGRITAGDVGVVRDFTDVRDVVRAYDLLLRRGRPGEIYNICSGRGVALRRIVEVMAGIMGLEVEIGLDERLLRPAENRVVIGSNEKIKRELGWEPQIPLEKSLADLLAWWEANYRE